MKTSSSHLLRAILLASSIFLLVPDKTRAEDIIISQFNDADSISRWRFDFGGVTSLIEFDATQDAQSEAASGSMKVTFGFDAAALNPSGNNKGAVTIDLPAGLDGLGYVTMEMDLRIEPGSATDGSGNSGGFQMVIRNGNNYDWNSQFGSNVSTNDGWRHITATVIGARDNIRAITLELSGGGSLTGPVVFHVDNLKFTKPTLSRDIFVSQFDYASTLSNWRFDYGGVTNLIQFDSSLDVSNNAASGSMQVTFGFDAALDISGNNKGAFTVDLGTAIDASTYQSLELDLKVDPSSATDTAGNSGYFQLVVRYSGFYDWNPQFGGDIRSSDGWRRIRIAPPVAPVDDIHAFTIELNGGAGITGPVTFNVDNLKFTTTNVAPPSPQLVMEHPTRGLSLTPTAGQFQRQNIAATNDPGYGWVGSAEPVSYSLTIHKHPGAAHSGYQTHMILVPAAPSDSAPDYSQSHVIFLDIQGQASGGAFAAFRYKVNEPNGNNFLYGAGTLGGVSSSTPLGTWSLTFTENTNATVTAPDGTVGAFVLPEAAAALFVNPLTVFVGAQPNSGPNIGQAVVLSSVRVTKGSTTLLEDNFLTAETLDPQKWQVFAGDPIGVQVIGSSAAFWLSWTIPDSGFNLQATSNVGDSGSWANTSWAPPLIGSMKKVLVHQFNDNPEAGKTYAPFVEKGFFRLFHP